MDYPPEVLTANKKGKSEVRNLIDKGEFVQYEYLDPKTGNLSENKSKIILKGANRREFFAVPMENGKMLLIPVKAKDKKTSIFSNGSIVEF